jgi:hypothetical protein
MSSIIQCVDTFGCLLKAIHDTLNPALWVIVYDETFSDDEATKLIHLHKLVGLNSREFTCLLRVCDLEGGKSLRNKWLQLFQTSNIDGFELDTKKVLGTRTWVLRIGNKEKGSFKDAKQQLQRRVRAPSLNCGIIQQLKTKLKQCIKEVMNTETTDTPRVNNETTQHNNSDQSNETPRTDSAEIITSQQLNEQSPINMLMNFDWSQLNDGELQKIQYHVAKVEQQVNVAIINTVASNLVSQINSLGNGRRRLDRKNNPYETALDYLQKKGIDISKAALKTRVSRVLKKQSKQIVDEVNVASSPSSSISTLTSSPNNKPGRPKGTTKQKKAEDSAKRAKCIDMIAHMYEIEKRNCMSDRDRKRVEQGYLKDLIREMKSTHGVPGPISCDTIRSRIKRGRSFIF